MRADRERNVRQKGRAGFSLFLLFLLFLLSSLFLSSCRRASGSGGRKSLRLVVFEDPGSEGGQQALEAIRYAKLSRGTLKLGGEEYELELLEKDPNDPAALQEILEKEKRPAACLGCFRTEETLLLRSALSEQKIPMINGSSVCSYLTREDPWLFRIAASSLLQGTAMANEAYRKGCRNAAILFQEDDPDAAALSECFRSAFLELGGKIAAESSFGEGEITEDGEELKKLLGSLQDQNPDFVYAPSSSKAGISILKAASSLSLSAPIAAGPSWELPSLLKDGEGAAEDCFFSLSCPLPEENEKEEGTEEGGEGNETKGQDESGERETEAEAGSSASGTASETEAEAGSGKSGAEKESGSGKSETEAESGSGSLETESGRRETIRGYREYLRGKGLSDTVTDTALLAYDSYMLFCDAAEKAGSTEPEKLRSALSHIDYHGLSGEIRFDKERNALRDQVFFVGVEQGEFRNIDSLHF